MEIETAMRKRLLASPTVTGYVVQKVFKYRLEEAVAGTGGRAVVVRRNGGWAKPDPTQTAEFPLMIVDCHADADRNEDLDALSASAEEKAWALFRVVDTEIHGLRHVWWGASMSHRGLLIISCARWGEPILLDPHRMRGGIDRAVTSLEDTHVVSVQYAIQTVHGD